VLVLDKVIIIRNVTFNENILYSLKAYKQLDSYLVIKACSIIKLIKEEEVQDINLILDNLNI
jgi:hypothetical protein